MLDYYGYVYSPNCKNYYLQLGARSGSSDVAVLCVDYLVAATATSPAGTFEVDNSNSFDSASVIGGSTGGRGTYYALLDKDGNIKKMSLVTGGTMSISVEGDQYSIVCDFTDINGTKIKATYNGGVEYTDNTQSSAALSLGEPHSALRSFSTAAQLSERCTIATNIR